MLLVNSKELSLCSKSQFSNFLYNQMMQTVDISNLDLDFKNRSHSLKFLRSLTLGCKDIGI